MEVSIILSSYNRYPFLLLSLYALENQNFDLSQMEVILVDDASTDQTPLLKNYHPPYSFKYIRGKKNKGVAATRNRGLKYANGKVIIFLDAEMIVDPDYVRNNYRHHVKNDQAVVISKKVKRLYSFLYSAFNARQEKEFNRLVEKSSKVKKRLAMKAGVDEKTTFKDLISMRETCQKPLQLVDKDDIRKFNILQSFSCLKRDITPIMTQLGSDYRNSPIVWLACFGNLSVKKSFVKKVGGFDPEFKKWGEEDREFAYRLYKNGAVFIVDQDLTRYHQEHPESSDKVKGKKANELLLLRKHPELNVAIKALNKIHKQDFSFLNQIVKEHRTLCKKFPGQFEEFTHALVVMLQQICVLNSKNQEIKNLLQAVETTDESIQKDQLFMQRNQIESIGEFDHVVKLFDILTNQ